jgi:triosephosphate isomerase
LSGGARSAAAERPLVGTSTKMNLTSTETAAYLEALVPLVRNATATCDLFVLPPFTSIWVAREKLRDTAVAWGAQDVHPADAGAHTGDVSGPMLADLGCRYVEVGHSERRRDHGETGPLVAAKIAAILRLGMVPILCVGEPTRRPLAAALRFLRVQLRRSVAGIDPADLARLVVAYEPVWAIGVGSQPADPAHVGAVHRAIHRWLSACGDDDGARVIYGGSVDPGVAPEILAQDGVDGLFVGRSALDPRRFAAIVEIAAANVAGTSRDRPART